MADGGVALPTRQQDVHPGAANRTSSTPSSTTPSADSPPDCSAVDTQLQSSTTLSNEYPLMCNMCEADRFFQTASALTTHKDAHHVDAVKIRIGDKRVSPVFAPRPVLGRLPERNALTVSLPGRATQRTSSRARPASTRARHARGSASAPATSPSTCCRRPRRPSGASASKPGRTSCRPTGRSCPPTPQPPLSRRPRPRPLPAPARPRPRLSRPLPDPLRPRGRERRRRPALRRRSAPAPAALVLQRRFARRRRLPRPPAASPADLGPTPRAKSRSRGWSWRTANLKEKAEEEICALKAKVGRLEEEVSSCAPPSPLGLQMLP